MILFNKKENELTSVGWAFWAVLAVILIGPCIWVAYQILLDRAPKPLPVLVGVTAALIGAGVISAVVNSLLQRREAKRLAVRRKKDRKKGGK